MRRKGLTPSSHPPPERLLQLAHALRSCEERASPPRRVPARPAPQRATGAPVSQAHRRDDETTSTNAIPQTADSVAYTADVAVASFIAPVIASPLSWLSPETLLEWAGPIAIWVAVGIVFAECGLLFGFFLPGDSLLFVVGLFVGNGTIDMPIALVCALLFVAAFAGNLVGYAVGYHTGPALFRREDSRIFKKKYIDHTEEFFNRYGAAAIVIGRFIAIVRTFITVLAGASRMDFKRYCLYSALGALLWAVGLTLLGYLIGNVPVIKNNLEIAIVLIVIVSTVPIFIHRLKSRSAAKHGG